MHSNVVNTIWRSPGHAMHNMHGNNYMPVVRRTLKGSLKLEMFFSCVDITKSGTHQAIRQEGKAVMITTRPFPGYSAGVTTS